MTICISNDKINRVFSSIYQVNIKQQIKIEEISRYWEKINSIREILEY